MNAPNFIQSAETDFDRVRNGIENAFHAPGELYTSPKVFALEGQELFFKEWIHAGRDEEMLKPGDFITLKLLGKPIVVIRNRQGKVNAFYNVCPHRGVELVTGNGNSRSLLCPYHGWVFDLEGKLKGAAGMEESGGFVQADCNLRGIRTAEWQGNIFICLDPDTPAFEDYARDFIADFDKLNLGRCRLGYKITAPVACNWKMALENTMDLYHVRVLHSRTIGAKFTFDHRRFALRENGGYSMDYDAAPTAPGNKSHLPRMPWLEGEDEGFSVTGFLSPNTLIFGRIDSARMIIVNPLTVDTCEFIIYSVFPEETFNIPNVREIFKQYEDFHALVVEEDRSVIESIQNVMKSGAFKPGPMSLTEKPQHHFLNSVLEKLQKGAGNEAIA